MKNTKKVTVEINEDTYARLEALAQAMNGVSWCGDDNSVKTIIEEFCLGGEIDTEMVKDNIVAAIDTMSVPDSVVDRIRRDELQEAFNKVA